MRKSETFRLTLRSCGIMYFVAIIASCISKSIDYFIYDMGCSPIEIFIESLFPAFFITGFFAGISLMFIIISRKKWWYRNTNKINNKKDEVTISNNNQSDINNNEKKNIDNNLPFDTQVH